jgi:hypothetical protein
LQVVQALEIALTKQPIQAVHQKKQQLGHQAKLKFSHGGQVVAKLKA